MKITFHILLIIIWTVFCFGSGYVMYDTLNNSSGILSGVRGGGRTGFWTLEGEDVAIGTSTVTEELTVDGDIYATGDIFQDSIYHAYGGIMATSVTIALTENVWATTTNAYGGLFTGLEADGMTLSNDIMTITNAGDYIGSLAISFFGGNANDYEFRFYNYTSKSQEGYTVYHSTGGTANYENVTLPIYFDVNAGDQMVFQVRNVTDSDDVIIRSAIFSMQYLHN